MHRFATSVRYPERNPRAGQARGGSTWHQYAPRLQIGEIGRQRPHGVVAPAFAGAVLERGNIVVGQKLGELVSAIKGQDGVEGIQFLGAPQHVRGHCS